MPLKKYQVIYADPPWKTKAGRTFGKYTVENGKQIRSVENNDSRELSYPTMTLQEIENLPVNNLAADNAHLYLWVTNQYLLSVQSIITKWGFKYSTALVWAKNPMGGGLGGNYKITTEFLLFCTRGNLKAKTHHIGTWFNEKREYKNGYPHHSRKPAFFHSLIEKVSPGPYLELFARQNREGWDVFGNEIENSVNIFNYDLDGL